MSWLDSCTSGAVAPATYLLVMRDWSGLLSQDCGTLSAPISFNFGHELTQTLSCRGTYIDSVTVIFLVISLGLAVDYSVHVSHGYLATREPDQELRLQKTMAVRLNCHARASALCFHDEAYTNVHQVNKQVLCSKLGWQLSMGPSPRSSQPCACLDLRLTSLSPSSIRFYSLWCLALFKDWSSCPCCWTSSGQGAPWQT